MLSLTKKNKSNQRDGIPQDEKKNLIYAIPQKGMPSLTMPSPQKKIKKINHFSY